MLSGRIIAQEFIGSHSGLFQNHLFKRVGRDFKIAAVVFKNKIATPAETDGFHKIEKVRISFHN